MALGIAYNARRVENPLKVPRRIQDRSTGHLCSLLENHCNALAGDVRMKTATVHRKTRHSTGRFWVKNQTHQARNHQRIQVTNLKVLYLLQHLQLFYGLGIPLRIGRIHTAYICEDSSMLGTSTCWWKKKTIFWKQGFGGELEYTV